jgi:hypothetical protein
MLPVASVCLSSYSGNSPLLILSIKAAPTSPMLSHAILIAFRVSSFDVPNMTQPEANPLGISDNLERREVNAALADDLKIFARRKWPLSTDEWRMSRLANMIGVGTRRMKSLYQGEATAVLRQHEAEAIAKLLNQRQIEEANRNDFQVLQARIARLEAALFASDEEFHQPQMAAFRNAADDGR